MIFCRFSTGDAGTEAKYGMISEHAVMEISPNPFDPFEVIGEPIPLSQISLLAPTLPSKIVAVGVNYKEHAKEMDHALPEEPKIFLKPPSAVISHEEAIRYPTMAARVDFEGELAVVMKQRAKNIEPENTEKYILGYTCFNDVTARDLQKKDGQWSRAKGFDTFAPMGPWIVSELDVTDLPIESYLNGELKQSGRTRDMIFKVPELVSFISKIMTLQPGDLIATGTPSGIGPMKAGDQIDIRIEGIGVLRNTVATG